MESTTVITEAEILERIVAPQNGNMSPEAARVVLGFKFDRNTTKQIRQLLQKNNRGTISASERLMLERFLRVGKFIDILHAKARLSLQDADTTR
jgi:hypothetical protein